MDFSIPGSDSWETTPAQEMFIETYFQTGQVPTPNRSVKRKKKKTEACFLKPTTAFQKKKKQKVAPFFTKSPPILISESCYKLQPSLSLQNEGILKKDILKNSSQLNDDFVVSSQITVGKLKKKKCKNKSSNADHNESNLSEAAAVQKKKKSAKIARQKQHLTETLSKHNGIHISKTESSDEVMMESEEELLREEIQNCDVFKMLQKFRKKMVIINNFDDSKLSGDESPEGDSDDSSKEDNVTLVDSASTYVNSKPLGKTKKDNKKFPVKVNSIRVPKIKSNKKSEGSVFSTTSCVDGDIKLTYEQSSTRNKNCKEEVKNSVSDKALTKLKAAKFRYLNEKLYTNTGDSAFKYFNENLKEFFDYHTGYSLQVSKWPMNPVDRIISDLQKMEKNIVIADLGCGDGKIAQTLINSTVYSFDLVALNEHVTACDISKVPLPNGSVDVVVFCLSLMGVNLIDYLREAHRILKLGGTLKVAEVESRIQNIHDFTKRLKGLGFALEAQNLEHKIFIFLDLKKEKKKVKTSNTLDITLKPCLYKKR